MNQQEQSQIPQTPKIPVPKLWNKNFAILVIGSFISMVGYTCATFAMSLLVYDTTKSVFLYAMTLVASMLPRIVMPIVSGTFFDRHSRRKAIPRIDYCYTFIFVSLALFIHFDVLQYWMYLVVSALLGSLDGMYMVAFDSIFPLLTTTETTRKAYSINSMLYPIASIITAPLTLLGYDTIGPVNIFIGASCLFVVTATVELFIKVREPHLVVFHPEEQAKLPPSPKEIEYINRGDDITKTLQRTEKSSFFKDFKEGVKYIAGEKGLLAITIYFFIISLCGAVQSTLMLPYFRDDFQFIVDGKLIDGMWAYLSVFGASTIGRLIGANVQYRVKFKKEIRYKVAVFVYIATNALTIIVFHLPIYLMMICMFVEGMLSVTSYNIRISSTSTYVPDEKRGRFNGTFLFFNMLGSIIGQFVAGAIGDIGWSVPVIMSVTFAFNLLFVFIIVIPAKKHISPIYNSDL